eukprot:TRINITY_DN46562_c0_g1_i1.p1 TRINITY_DN46562_c0_g1~~TRINITY_DN46562_c0_g1_i1.p1  ORF type:complete len:276 (+),score=40.40 TRINITY_DN46562_c0_g1_i1:59-886(+)
MERDGCRDDVDETAGPVQDSASGSTSDSRRNRWRKDKQPKEGAVDVASLPQELADDGMETSPSGFKFYVVLDFEATCVEHGELRPQEIIEFPLVLVDARRRVIVDEFRSYVRPTHHPQLSEFCTGLTGIQQEQVDNAPEFEDVFLQACRWLEHHGLCGRSDSGGLIVTCGDWDLDKMLPRQFETLGLPAPPRIFRQWANVKRTFSEALGTKAGGMLNMLNVLGLRLEGRHHSGLDDCRNIARLLCELCRRKGDAIVRVNGWREWSSMSRGSRGSR